MSYVEGSELDRSMNLDWHVAVLMEPKMFQTFDSLLECQVFEFLAYRVMRAQSGSGH